MFTVYFLLFIINFLINIRHTAQFELVLLMLDNNMHYLSSRWWPPKPPLPLPIPCVSVLWYETRTRIQASVRWRYTAVRWSSRRQMWLCCYWWNSGGTWSDRLEREPMTSQRSGQCVQLRKFNTFGFVSWWEEMQANGQKQKKCMIP